MNEHRIEITIRSQNLCLNHQMHFIHNGQQRKKIMHLPIDIFTTKQCVCCGGCEGINDFVAVQGPYSLSVYSQQCQVTDSRVPTAAPQVDFQMTLTRKTVLTAY